MRRNLLGELLEGKPHEQFLWGGAGNGRGISVPRQSLTRQETFRFVKQSYHLEDIRVLRYQRFKTLVLRVAAAAYLATTFLGQKLKLKILCEKLRIISRRFFGIPPFRFYALSDGIQRILSRSAPDLPPRTTQNISTGTTSRMESLKK